MEAGPHIVNQYHLYVKKLRPGMEPEWPGEHGRTPAGAPKPVKGFQRKPGPGVPKSKKKKMI
jgi:hypothetical protein